jgi:drug/metabolite transporter (DMT)-like permease
MPVSTSLVAVTSIGVVALGALSYGRIGVEGMLSTPSQDFAVMLLAGVCNAAAFWSLTTALRLVTLAYTNALNASQAAMAAVAGVIFFSEALTLAMGSGIVLTVLGLLLMKNERRKRDDRRRRTRGRTNSLETSPPPSRTAPMSSD